MRGEEKKAKMEQRAKRKEEVAAKKAEDAAAKKEEEAKKTRAIHSKIGTGLAEINRQQYTKKRKQSEARGKFTKTATEAREVPLYARISGGEGGGEGCRLRG